MVDIFIALELEGGEQVLWSSRWGRHILFITTGFWQPCADLGGTCSHDPVSDGAEVGGRS